jgi:hypothetical protein
VTPAVIIAGIVCATVLAIAIVGSVAAVAITRHRLLALDLETLPPEIRTLRIAGLKGQRSTLESRIGYSLCPSRMRKQIGRIDAELAILCRTDGSPRP